MNYALCRVAAVLVLAPLLTDASLCAQDKPPRKKAAAERRKQRQNKKNAASQPKVADAKNTQTGKAAAPRDPELARFGIYEQSAPRAAASEPVVTKLPFELRKGDRIALIGNTLLERSQLFGHIEALLHQRYPAHRLIVRNLAWPADTASLQPRPANFADIEQHLTHEKADVILAAFGFNESFAGPGGIAAFKESLSAFLTKIRSRAFNGDSAARIVLVSPIANENVTGVPAADMNNANIQLYVDAMHDVAAAQQVGFANVFADTREALRSPGSELTLNGAHLTEEGYAMLARSLYRQLFDEAPPRVDHGLRLAVIDKNRQYARRYRPLNTFYYTGGRNQSYGYLDFLPAMRNFDIMTENRDQRIHFIAMGKSVPEKVDDSNVPPLPETTESRGANRWITAEAELQEFTVDPRFEVNLFAGEEEFPDIAAPIQMRWDALGRLWVSCSTTYPHVYPGNEPDDKLVILEDTDGDGKADKSTVFADDLHIPLSFEFGDGGVYVSEMPHLTFIKDTDGDGKADHPPDPAVRLRHRGLAPFALHDFTWTPDGDLI